MFSNTAYEVFYLHMGLAYYEKMVLFLRANPIVSIVVYMIMAFVLFRIFLMLSVGKGKAFLISFGIYVGSVFLAFSILSFTTDFQVLDYKKKSWVNSGYFKNQIEKPKRTYKVSAILNYIVTPIEVLTASFSRWIDKELNGEYLQTERPNYVFRAILAAGTATLTDPAIVSKLDKYNEECMSIVLNYFIKDKNGVTEADKQYLFKNMTMIVPDRSEYRRVLKSIYTKDKQNCGDLAQEVRGDVDDYVQNNKEIRKYRDKLSLQRLPQRIITNLKKLTPDIFNNSDDNYYHSGVMANYYLDKHGGMGVIDNRAHVSSFQGLAVIGPKITNAIDSLLSKLDPTYQGSIAGSMSAAATAQDFGSHLRRAPHLRGMIKMILVWFFPIMFILLIGGKPKWIFGWALTYFSISMWEPIWTAFYYIMQNISVSSESIRDISEYTDGFTAYSSHLLTRQMSYIYSQYATIQVISGPAFSGMFSLFVTKPLLTAKQSEGEGIMSSATTAVGMATGGVSSGVAGVVKGGVSGAMSSNGKSGSEDSK